MAKRTPAERFWAKVNRDGPVPDYAPHLGPCWIWTGARGPTGYGKSHGVGGRSRAAHRHAYELVVGPIPTGLHLDHLCRIRPCVNPAHLEPVTCRENNRRAPKENSICAIGEANRLAKLTAEQVREIRYLYANGVRQADLARQFKVTEHNITLVIRRVTWKHVL